MEWMRIIQHMVPEKSESHLSNSTAKVVWIKSYNYLFRFTKNNTKHSEFSRKSINQAIHWLFSFNS